MIDSMVLNMVGQPGGWLSYSGDGGSAAVTPTASVNGYGTVGGGLQVGQISLSLLALGVIGLMAFYAWTRGVQK